ncbi:MAG: site-specific DNA-methyltransferase, partial [Planctomycetaceae bacterium]|nr:site-specific DNA-methyltransferase [Planctomycetaceae bacterium]
GDKYQNGVLLGIPWRLAFALSDGGLVLKNEIIWHKRRIMPQSAKNRFTYAHETVFFFTKKPKGFTFNYEDVMEDALWKNDRRAGKGPVKYAETREKNNNGHTCPVVIRDKRLCRNVWDFTTRKEGGRHSATYPYGLAERCILAGSNKGDTVLDPFAGTCTTGFAAEDNGREFVGVDISDSAFPVI